MNKEMIEINKRRVVYQEFGAEKLSIDFNWTSQLFIWASTKLLSDRSPTRKKYL